MKALKEIYERRTDITTELLAELEAQFPVGTVVAFMIMSGQKNPSTGIVVSYRGNGCLNVEHIQAKHGSRFSHRDVFFEDVII